MKVMIVGLGSMGKRRARLLKGILPDVCLLGVDSAPARRAEAEALGFTTYETLAAGIAAAPDAAFVCTAPISHAGIISSSHLAAMESLSSAPRSLASTTFA